jgi:hypothetical protein
MTKTELITKTGPLRYGHLYGYLIVKLHHDDEDDTRFVRECDGELTHTREFCITHGLDFQPLYEDVLKGVACCDCEVLMNVEENMPPSRVIPKRYFISPETALVGYVPVDSGQIIITDPCYVLPSEDDAPGITYEQVCNALKETKAGVFSRPHESTEDKYLGVVSRTGMGDGVYPVYVQMKGERVARLIIDFSETIP